MCSVRFRQDTGIHWQSLLLKGRSSAILHLSQTSSWLSEVFNPLGGGEQGTYNLQYASQTFADAGSPA